MIRNWHHCIKNLFAVLLIVFLMEGRAQPLPYLSFSSIATLQNGNSWLSQPLSASLKSACLSLYNGLGLHYAVKRNGIFLVDCFEQVSLSEIKFIFYPNPAHSTATLSVLTPGAVNHKVQLQLVDALGRLLRSQWVTLQDLHPGYTLDMSPFSPGMYFLRISSFTFNSVIKIIKL